MKADINNKKKAQQILATVVMGMNLVNTVAPLAVAIKTAPEALPAVPRPAKSEAQPLDYAVLPHTVAIVDELIFSKAEAADYVVPGGGSASASIGSMSGEDTMSVGNGGTGVIGSMDVTVTSSAFSVSNSGEYSSGGTATAGYTSGSSGNTYSFGTGGTQVITDGGTGIIESNLGGTQVVNSGGSGHIDSLSAQLTSDTSSYMTCGSNYINGSANSGNSDNPSYSKNGGVQVVNSGGTGTIGTNEGGTQVIASGGSGHIGTLGTIMSSGYGQASSSYTSADGGTTLYTSGYTNVFYQGGGVQSVASGAEGSVDVNTGGSQVIANGGTGYIGSLGFGDEYEYSYSSGYTSVSDGSTITAYSSVGSYTNVSGGSQIISNGAVGSVGVMDGGVQITTGGTGYIGQMQMTTSIVDDGSGGTYISSRYGSQIIGGGGTGIIGTMSGGSQYLSSGGLLSVGTMYAGSQENGYRGGGTAIVDVMSGGRQNFRGGGYGSVGTMYGGSQLIASNGSGAIDIMYDGNQNVGRNGLASVGTMYSGLQYASWGGVVIAENMSGGVQSAYFSNALVSASAMAGGTQIVDYSGQGRIDVMDGGTQILSGGNNAVVSTMTDGLQQAIGSGNATISTMVGGTQYVSHNSRSGNVTIVDMSGGVQQLASGVATISTMSGGEQVIGDAGAGYNDASGNIIDMQDGSQTMSGGTQAVGGGTGSALGSVAAMIGGSQVVCASGKGLVNDLQAGAFQIVSSGGTASALGTVNGSQVINDGGTGYVETFTDKQVISSGGTGVVNTFAAGDTWNLADGQTGVANAMSGGTQTIAVNAIGSAISNYSGQQVVNGGSGWIRYNAVNGSQKVSSGAGNIEYNSGYQDVYDGGTGSIGVMYSGQQDIHNGGYGSISQFYNGSQNIGDGGYGEALGNLGGTQYIADGGTGYVESYTANQIISSGGTGIIETLTAEWSLTDGQTGIANTMSGGTQTISTGAVGTVSALLEGEQVVEDGGTALATTIKGGMQTVNSGGTANATVVSGGGVQYIENGAVISGTEVQTDGVLRLAQDGDSAFALTNALTINGGTIDMTDGAAATALGRSVRAGATPTYQSLTVNSLEGSGGKLLMDTDLAGGTGDTLTVDGSNAGTGSYGISVKDLSAVNGTEVTGEHKLLLVTDNSGKLEFTGRKENFGGLWDVDPTLEQNGNYWYLTKLAKTVNNDTAVLLDAADNSYALWRNTNDSLRGRLGALGNGSEQADGVWARTQAGRFSGDNYEGRYNMYQFGYDKVDNAKSIYGAAVDYGDGTGSYADGSGKDKLKTFSLYGVWTGDSGTYTNVTARYGIVSTDLESYGDFPDKAAYKEHAYSVSVEYGKRLDLESGLFFEPNAQFTLGRLGGISYTTDRGANGNIDGMNSAIGRIGFVLGQKVTGGSDIYLKADLLHEFAGERDLQLTSDAGGTNDILNKHNDYGDTWFELGLGGSVKLSKAGDLYGEVVRGFGGYINKKWSLNAGLRFTF